MLVFGSENLICLIYYWGLSYGKSPRKKNDKKITFAEEASIGTIRF